MTKSTPSFAAEAAKREAHEKAKASRANQENTELDEALEESFPASDPPSQTQPETSVGTPAEPRKKP